MSSFQQNFEIQKPKNPTAAARAARDKAMSEINEMFPHVRRDQPETKGYRFLVHCIAGLAASNRARRLGQ